ncbi:hypothetical protein BSSX_1923 [Bacillus subtilis]|nr:hypothetical protein BSSX_1923 [Bacillus subtilis]
MEWTNHEILFLIILSEYYGELLSHYFLHSPIHFSCNGLFFVRSVLPALRYLKCFSFFIYKWCL